MGRPAASRGRIGFLAAGVVVAAVSAVVFFAPGTGNDESEGPFAPIAQAAERTTRVPGARIELAATLEAPANQGTIEMRGHGAYNGETDRSRFVMRVAEGAPLQGASVPAEDLTTTQVTEGLVVYLRMPAFEGELPEGKTWMKMDLGELVGEAAVGTAGGPQQQFRQLRAVSSDARRIGVERVRGVQAVHYAATIDMRREVDRLRQEGEDEGADLVEALIEAEGTHETPVEVWVDDRGYVRRMITEFSFATVAGEGATMRMREDLYDFGVKPKISLPSEEDVFDGTELAQDAFEAIVEQGG
jgi:hypothetical protein